MAKFLNTEGISYHLSQIIDHAKDKLYLISPYLKINDRMKDSLKDKDKFKIDIRIIYGKSELQPSELNWLKSLTSIRTSFYKELHAKCYLNENEIIVTSMNLYDYSQVNNYEMGIYIEKAQDAELYKGIYEEVQRLLRNSKEVRISVAEIPNSFEKPEITTKSSTNSSGFCIRCHTDTKLNPMTPYCKSCYTFWKIDGKEDHEEQYCHVCGKPNKSCLLKPTCYDCYKTHKDRLEFPLASK
jgi:phosphatidylserine/phosphatidylglycerophosphate/cardiolipin synthase-like enzyme